jgi:hypothetical protein
MVTLNMVALWCIVGSQREKSSKKVQKIIKTDQKKVSVCAQDNRFRLKRFL